MPKSTFGSHFFVSLLTTMPPPESPRDETQAVEYEDENYKRQSIAFVPVFTQRLWTNRRGFMFRPVKKACRVVGLGIHLREDRSEPPFFLITLDQPRYLDANTALVFKQRTIRISDTL